MTFSPCSFARARSLESSGLSGNQARAAGVSDVYAPGGAGEGGQVQRGFALECVERQGEEAPVRREAVRRQRERPVSGQRKRGRAAQPRRFLPGEAARGRVHVGAAGERVGEVLVVAQRLQAKILRIQLQRPPRLLREGGTRHVHHAQHAQPGALLMGNPPPSTGQATYDARSSVRKRTANDESGSAPCVRSRICRSDKPVSVAVSPFAAQMARPKGSSSISCIKSSFQNRSIGHAYVSERSSRRKLRTRKAAPRRTAKPRLSVGG